MADPTSSPTKGFLVALHDFGKWILHVALIPVIAVFKAVCTGLQHLYDALSKI